MEKMWMYQADSDSPSARGTSPLPGSVSPPEGRGSTQQQRIRRRNRLITSCLECRRRKLKCDKQAPCTNCTRFKRDCLYLAPSQDSKSQQKLADIKEKMGLLEQSLENEVANQKRRPSDVQGTAADQYVKQEPQSDEEAEDEEDLEPTVLTAVDTVYEDDGDDELMDLGIQLGKVRISERIGGWVRPKLVEELTDTLHDVKAGKSRWSTSPQMYDHYNINPSQRQQNIQQSLKSFLGPGEDYIAPSTSFFFPGTNMATSLIDYLPTKAAADQLISQYFAVVHYLAKVVHRPTFEAQYHVFWTEIGNGNEPAPAIQAIMFAAMFSAVVSMSENQVLRSFGSAKPALIDSFRSGTELALAKANFLRATKTDTMQAFVMYLIPLVRAEVSRAHSALMGAAIRLAECMGLHRDPSIYSMGPIETHVRRMIWYQLCFLDMRTCESTGPRPQIRREDYDTKLPLNIDDTDLLDPMAQLQDQTRWTDMTLTRLRFESIEMQRNLWFDIQQIDKKKKSLTSVLIKVQKFRSRMEEYYGEMLDNSVPLQSYAAHVLRIYTSRCFIQVLHRYLHSAAQRIPDRLRQIILTSGTESMEAAISLETTPEFAPWVWYKGAYQQYHVALLLLLEVYAYPMRKEAGRIWDCLDYIFELPKQLSPKQKAEMLITDMRDRMQVYQSMRKLKASTQMEERMNAMAQSRRDSTGSRGSSIPQNSHPSLGGSMPQHIPEFSFAHLTPSHFSPPNFHSGSSVDGSRSASMSVQGDNGGGGGGGSNNTMMEDIDWAELDKYFPIDSNSGELNEPNFDLTQFTGGGGHEGTSQEASIGGRLATEAPATGASAGGIAVPSIEDLADVTFTPTYLTGYVGQKDSRAGQ